MASLIGIDFEASCLPIHGRSFPIEVGLAHEDGRSRAWQIRPDPAWADWSWTFEAERLHGLTREEIERNGLPAGQVIAEMVDFANGGRLLADSHLDDLWFKTLCAAARTRPPLKIDHLCQVADELALTSAEIRSAVQSADRAAPLRHRARLDALWVVTVATGLSAAAARRAACGSLLFNWNPAGERSADEAAHPTSRAGDPPGLAHRIASATTHF